MREVAERHGMVVARVVMPRDSATARGARMARRDRHGTPPRRVVPPARRPSICTRLFRRSCGAAALLLQREESRASAENWKQHRHRTICYTNRTENTRLQTN